LNTLTATRGYPDTRLQSTGTGACACACPRALTVGLWNTLIWRATRNLGEEVLTHPMQRDGEGEVRNASMGLIDDMFEEVLGSDANIFRNKLFVTDVLCLQMPYNFDLKTFLKHADKQVPGFTERFAQATMNGAYVGQQITVVSPIMRVLFCYARTRGRGRGRKFFS